MTTSTVKLEDITAASSAADFEAALKDPETPKKLIAENRFGQFITDYAGAKTREAADWKQQVKDQVQLTLSDWVKDHPDQAGSQRLAQAATDVTADAAVRKQGLYNARAVGAELDQHFGSMGEFLATTWHGADQGDPKVRDLQQKVRATMLSSDVPSEGGFLIPERLRSELLRVALETAVVRPRARIVPMDSLRVPFPAVDSTGNNQHLYGGVIGYWTEEGAALAASEPAFSRIVLDAKKLTAYTEVPNELLSDSIVSFESFINEIFPEALAYYEDIAFMRGTGVGEPLGFLNAAAKITVTQASGAGSIVWADIVNMYARMLPGSLMRSVWVAHISTFPALATMELSAGSPATWVNNLSEGAPMSILGRPVIFTEKVPALGSANAINLVDFGYYLIGDRQAMSARSSEEYRFRNDQTAFRFIERLDGRPWLTSAITPNQGSDTLSPFVSLGAPVT